MLDSISRTVTKDYYGPLFSMNPEGVKVPAWVCRFQDSFSTLGWGKMPDVLSARGISQAVVHHHLASLLGSKEAWKEFLRSPDALTFRKAASFIPHHADALLANAKGESVGSMLNDMSEHFPLRQSYLGMVSEACFKNLKPNETVQGDLSLNAMDSASEQSTGYGLFQIVPEQKIPLSTVLGRTVRDYSVWKSGLLPFEFKCHFELRDESLAALNTESLVISKTATASALKVGSTWDFPLIETVLAQDPFQNRVGFNEILWITKLSPPQIQKILLSAAWIAAFLRWTLAKSKVNLIEANLQFALNEEGALMLAGTQTLDELKVEFEGQSFHTDETLSFYQKTNWYESVIHSQKVARQQGLPDWKRLCVETAPWLEPKFKSQFEKRAPIVANKIVGKKCFLESKPD